METASGTILVVVCFLLAYCSAQSDTPTGSNSNDEVLYWVILGLAVSIGLILILSVAIYCLYLCRKYYYMKTQWHYQYHEDTGMNRLVERSTSLGGKDVEIPRKDICILQPLGSGDFGPVYDAEVRLDINMLSRALIRVFQRGSPEDLSQFREEVEAVMEFNHPKVVQLLGVVSRLPYYAVFELPVNGDLKTFLTASTVVSASMPVIGTAHLVSMATNVASGLEYLEDKEYVHSDLAARSCMVTQDLQVKVADYKVGQNLFENEYSLHNGYLKPIRWMAPESLLNDNFSLSSTVWSFGVLLWEVLTRGSFPFVSLGDQEVISGVCYTRKQLDQPKECSSAVYNLMQKCWEYDVGRRPKMSAIHKQLVHNNK